jgi:hypothetical protein
MKNKKVTVVVDEKVLKALKAAKRSVCQLASAHINAVDTK